MNLRFAITFLVSNILITFAGLAQQLPVATQPDSQLQKLSSDFWAWRSGAQPFSTDDIPRLNRPHGWAADWSTSTIAKHRNELAAFEGRWKGLASSIRSESRAETVDYLLVGSAIARARWELDYLRGWQRNPWFYLDQTLTSVFVSLLQPPPFDEARSAEIVRRIQAIPQIIADGETNLKDPSGPLAQLSIDQLKDIRPRLEEMARELKPKLAAASASRLDPGVGAAIQALEDYRGWLQQRLSGMSKTVAVGRDGYLFFLKHVALLPYTPEQLVTIGLIDLNDIGTGENQIAGNTENRISKFLGIQAPAVEAPVGAIPGILREVGLIILAAELIYRAQHDRLVQFLDGPAMLDKLRRHPWM